MSSDKNEGAHQGSEALYHQFLLEIFEPVLRFSAGERFFPMDVHDFIANCRLLKAIRYRSDRDCTNDWYNKAREIEGITQGKQPSPQALARALGGFNGQHYLHFVHERGSDYLRIILMLMIGILVLLPAYGLLSERIWSVQFSGWGMGETLKALLVIFVMVIWPLIQTDRKAYLAFVLLIVSSQFLGTQFGYAIGIFGGVVLVFFFIAYLFLRAGWNIWERMPESKVLSTLMDNSYWLWMLYFVSAVIAIISIWDRWEYHPLDFEGYLVFELFVFAVFTLLGWFALGAIFRKLRQRRNKLVSDSWLKQINNLLFEELYKPVWVIGIAVVLVVILSLMAYFEANPQTAFIFNNDVVTEQWDGIIWRFERREYDNLHLTEEEENQFLLPREIGEEYRVKGTYLFWKIKESAYWLRVGILAATVLLWYALDPLPIWRPKALYPYDKRQRYFGWNLRILGFIALGVLLWIGGNWWFLTLKESGSVHRLTLFYVTIILTIVFIGLIMGTKMMSALLDALSRQPDIDADYAAQKYHKRIKAGQHYYGRVLEADGWTVLQYHYFYAFNDYRRIAGGMNNHEGDWEAIAVYLKHEEDEIQINEKDVDGLIRWKIQEIMDEVKELLQEQPDQSARKEKLAIELKAWQDAALKERLSKLRPYGVAYSQHHSGAFAFWPQAEDNEISDKSSRTDPCIVKRVWRQTSQGARPTYHPLVYPALGSHANYPMPDEYPAPEHFSGAMHRIVAQVNALFSKIRGAGGIEHIGELQVEADLEARKTYLDKEMKSLYKWSSQIQHQFKARRASSMERGEAKQSKTRSTNALSQSRLSQLQFLKSIETNLINKQLDDLKTAFSDLDEFKKFYTKAKIRAEQLKTIKADLLLEYATGDGLRIGYDDIDIVTEEEFELALQLPPKILERHRESLPDGRVRLPKAQLKKQIEDEIKKKNKDITEEQLKEQTEEQLKIQLEALRKELTEWQPKVLSPEDESEGWLAFQGLWGCNALQQDEAGPSGPKWLRPDKDIREIERNRDNYNDSTADLLAVEAKDKDEPQKVRLRWGPTGPQDALLWKDLLLLEMVNDTNLPVRTRVKALESIVFESHKTHLEILQKQWPEKCRRLLSLFAG